MLVDDASLTGDENAGDLLEITVRPSPFRRGVVRENPSWAGSAVETASRVSSCARTLACRTNTVSATFAIIDSARGFMTWSHPATEEYCCSVHKFEQQGRSSVLVSAGELHVRSGAQGRLLWRSYVLALRMRGLTSSHSR